MSTEYYRLRRPWTEVKRDRAKGDDPADLFTFHTELGYAGQLLIPRRSVERFLMSLADVFEGPSVHTYFGGSKVGTVVDARWDMPNSTILISSDANLTTMGEVRATRGAGKL